MSVATEAVARLEDAVMKFKERKANEISGLKKEVADLRQLVEDLKATQTEDIAALVTRIDALAKSVEQS